MRLRLKDAVAVLVGQRDEGLAAAGAAAAQTTRVRDRLAASTALERERGAEMDQQGEAHAAELAAVREANDAQIAALREAHVAEAGVLREARDEEHAAQLVAQWEAHVAEVDAMRSAHSKELGDLRGEVAALSGDARVLARGLRPLRVLCYELQCQKGLLGAQLRHAEGALAASRADAQRVHDDVVHLSRALTGKEPDDTPPPAAPAGSSAARRRWARAGLAVLAALRLQRMAAAPGGYLGLRVCMGNATISLAAETTAESTSPDIADDAAALVRISERYEQAAASAGTPLLRRLRRSWARPAEREPCEWVTGGVVEGASCHVDEGAPCHVDEGAPAERSTPARAVLELRRRALRVARALHESKKSRDGLERQLAELGEAAAIDAARSAEAVTRGDDLAAQLEREVAAAADARSSWDAERQARADGRRPSIRRIRSFISANCFVHLGAFVRSSRRIVL